jgi:hypothetical protein
MPKDSCLENIVEGSWWLYNMNLSMSMIVSLSLSEYLMEGSADARWISFSGFKLMLTFNESFFKIALDTVLKCLFGTG